MKAFCTDHFELFRSLRFTSKSDCKKSSRPRKEKKGPARSQTLLSSTSRQLNQSDTVQPVPLLAHLTRQGSAVMSSKRIIRHSFFDFDCFKTSYNIYMDISVGLFWYKQFIRSVDTRWLILILRRPKKLSHRSRTTSAV